MNLSSMFLGSFLITDLVVFLTVKLLIYKNQFEKLESEKNDFEQILKGKEGQIEQLEALQDERQETTLDFKKNTTLNDLIRSDFYNFTGDNQGQDDITYLLLERPEGEIINFRLKPENSARKKTEIMEFLNQNLWSGHSQLKTLKVIN